MSQPHQVFREVEEEAFVERFLDYGDTAEESFTKCLEVFRREYSRCTEFADALSDGECYDSSTAALCFSNLALAGQYAERFAEDVRRETGLSVTFRYVPESDSELQKAVNRLFEELGM